MSRDHIALSRHQPYFLLDDWWRCQIFASETMTRAQCGVLLMSYSFLVNSTIKKLKIEKNWKLKKIENWKRLKIEKNWKLKKIEILKCWILKCWNLENLENWKKGLKIMDFLKCSSVDFPKLWLNNVDVYLLMSCPWLRFVHWITLLFILFHQNSRRD